MAKTFMQRPPLSWSKSRKQTFDACKLQYWYQYYGYWNGWKSSVDFKVRRTYYLRNLTSYSDVVGVIVHDKIKDFLTGVQNGNVNSFEALMGSVDLHWQRVLNNTRNKEYLAKKNTMAVMQMHYGEPFNDIQEHIARTKSCLANAYKFIEDLPINPIDMFLIDDLENGFIPVNLSENQSLNLYAVIDFCYKTIENDETIYNIVDWKSGIGFDAESPVFQMKIYGLYLYNVHKIPLKNIRFTAVKLNGEQAEEIHYNFTEADFQEAYEVMDSSIQDMVKMDSFYQNQSVFKPTEDKNNCKSCKFREVCTDYARIKTQS